MSIHDFTFNAKSDAGPVTIHGGTQVGAFVVAPSFANLKNTLEHTVAHWPTGYALCRCVDFGLAMLVADDASRFAAVSIEALELDEPHRDAELETDDIGQAGKLIGDVVRWVEAISTPIKDGGRTVGYMVSRDTYKSYRDWRTG